MPSLENGAAGIQALNQHNHVLGSSFNGNTTYGLIWNSSAGSAAMSGFPSNAWVDTTSFNDNGDVVGTFHTTVSTPYLWNQSTGPLDLNYLTGSTYSLNPTAINNNLSILMSYLDLGGSQDSGLTLWNQATGFTEIEPFDGATSVNIFARMNNLDQVVSAAHTGGTSDRRAFYWDPISGALDLGDLPGGEENSYAGDSNDNTFIVGAMTDETGYKAVLWDSDLIPHLLGTLDGDSISYAMGINNLGQVVGGSGESSVRRPFLWDENNGMRDLHTLLTPGHENWQLLDVRDINDQGWIIGSGLLNGENRDFVARPVPEPASLLMALPAIALLRHKRSRSS